MDWHADEKVDPQQSATLLVKQVSRWLERVDAFREIAA